MWTVYEGYGGWPPVALSNKNWAHVARFWQYARVPHYRSVSLTVCWTKGLASNEAVAGASWKRVWWIVSTR